MSDIDTTQNSDNATESVAPNAAPAADTSAASAPATTGETPADTPQTPDKGKPEAGFQKALNRITRQRGEAERRALRLEAEVAELRKAVQGQSKGADLRPDQFPNYDAYVAALVKQNATAAAEEVVRARSDELSRGESSRASERREDAFVEKASAQAEGTGIDFDKVWDELKSAPILSPSVAVYLFDESKVPAQLVEYLAENLDDLERISALSPAAAKRALVKVEAGFKPIKTQPNATKAPPPVPTVGGRSVSQVDPEKITDMAEYKAYWNARNAKRG